MVKTKKCELPIIEPLYSAYLYQGPGTAVLANNPSIQNWYLNKVMMLSCTLKFLNGFTTPDIRIVDSPWNSNPYLDKYRYSMRFLDSHMHSVIRKLIDAGYYVCFTGVDDYYIRGKSWYQKRHFSHDGCICGYNQEDKTYCIYAYDQNFVYQKFWAPQKDLDVGKKAMFKVGIFGEICGIKPTKEQVVFSAKTALSTLAEYLNPPKEKYIGAPDDTVLGIVVHDYIAKYIEMLYDGSIPYEKMDRRIFRVIWEHKKVMHQRIKLIEAELFLDNTISNAYQKVVHEADNCRMLYASHHMKRRDSVLPIIQKKLIFMKELEEKLLKELLQHLKGT